MKLLIATSIFCLTVAHSNANAIFEPYKIIIDRSPFGATSQITRPQTSVENTTNFKPAAEAQFRLSALFQSIDGTIRAGLVGKTNNKSYVLKIEKPEDGIELISADLSKGTATISENGNSFVLELTKVKPSELAAINNSSTTRNAPSSFSERRRQLLERMNKNQPQTEPVEEKPRLRGEELQAHLQNYQMEVIRSGLPPLPIQLTEEMDQQLVDEGILPESE